MGVSLLRQCLQQPGETTLDELTNLGQAQDQTGIHDVLRGRAPVQVLRVLGRAHRRAKSGDQRRNRYAGLACANRHGGRFEVRFRCCAVYRRGAVRGYQPQLSLYLGQRPLDAHHRAYLGNVAEKLTDLVVAKEITVNLRIKW